MKAPITLAVLALHAAVITTILIGCNSTENQPEVNPDLSNDVSVADTSAPETVVEPTPKEGSQEYRAVPTRPVQNLQEVDGKGFAVNDKINSLNAEEPLPPADIKKQDASEAPKAVEGVEYKVKAGDNLSKIAKRNGVSLIALLDANNMTRDAILKVGQTLIIPGGTKAAADVSSTEKASLTSAETTTSTASTGYIVQKGDSLSKVAIKFNSSVKKIMELNGLKNTNIRVGQKLKVPSASSAKDASANISAKTSPESLKGKRVHKIARGETLGLVSKKYKVSVSKLMDLNSIKDPRKIREGQVIIIGESVEVAETAPVAISKEQTLPKVETSTNSENAIKVQPDSPATIETTPTNADTTTTTTAPATNVELPEIQEI